MVHGVKSKNKISFGDSWRHTNSCGAWKKNNLRTMTYGGAGLTVVKDLMFFLRLP